ncbi:MAG: hypothetical protein FJY75_14335, partial [Candidatus Eisenbacteria bacterium]|nr:hypothetical protein [Candidatus Eisenbacteria bacterium]
DRSRDNIREREQSLALELRNFQPGHVGRVYTPFLRDQSYMGYEALELWLNSTLPEESRAEFFLRLCKDATIDTTDYYEYRVAVPRIVEPGRRSGSWLPIKIALTDLSDLKAHLAADADTVSRSLPGGGRISIKGKPYLTKVRRITFGVVNQGAAPIENASVWVNELRLTHVIKDMDLAYRLQARVDLADIGHVDFNFKRVGSDFVSISGGGFRQAREEQTSYALSASGIPLERFLPRGTGLRLPFAYQLSRDRRVPKYRTNDDLLVGDRPTDRDITETVNRSYSLSLSRQASNRRLLRYTIDNLSLSGSLRHSHANSPFAKDSTVTRTGSANLALPFGAGGGIQLYRNWKVRLLPTAFSLGLTRSEKDQVRYRRAGGDLRQPFTLDDQRTIRSGGLSLAAGLQPISIVTYNFRQSRDLMLRSRSAWLGGLNTGRETSRTEDLSVSQQVRVVPRWFEPRLSWRGSFRGTFNQQGGVTQGGLDRFHDLTNNRTATMSFDVPLAALIDRLSQWGAAGPGGGG